MSPFGNPSAQALAGAAEKCIARMDDADLARALLARYSSLRANDRDQVIEALFDAFRDRGESSEDACEGAGIALNALGVGDVPAFEALLEYARENSGVLKEAFSVLIERQPASIGDLPRELVESIARRLAGPA